MSNFTTLLFQKVTRSKYFEMLEVLPPVYHNKGVFLVGEPTDHNSEGKPRYQAYFTIDDDFYTLTEPQTLESFAPMAENPELELDYTLEQEPDSETQTELDLLDRYSQEAIDAYKSIGFSDNLNNFEEAYVGQFDSDKDFAMQQAEDNCDIDFSSLPWPQNCIDWEYAARELMHDYSEANGYYFRNL